jgi:hypothetical protein
VGRIREDSVGLRSIPKIRIDENIVANFVPYQRSARLHGILGMRDAGQFLVFDRHRFSAVERLCLRLGNNHRDRFADMPRLVGR